MMKFRYKSGVRFNPVPELYRVLPAVLLAYWHLTMVREVWITSGNDSLHMARSKHYVNAAADFRVWWLTPGERRAIVDFLAEALGVNYDVLDEEDHIHLEYDPK